jgi:hypothetical protein
MIVVKGPAHYEPVDLPQFSQGYDTVCILDERVVNWILQVSFYLAGLILKVEELPEKQPKDTK